MITRSYCMCGESFPRKSPPRLLNLEDNQFLNWNFEVTNGLILFSATPSLGHKSFP